MRVLVTGGTGTVGSRVVARLLKHDRTGLDVRVLTSSPDKIDGLPDGARAVVGDLGDPDTLGEAFGGVDRLFLLTPLHPDEARLGKNGVEAAAEAGVERVVMLSVHRVDEGAHIPHFASKIEMAGALEEAGLDHVVLQPNNYFQNDLWFRQPLLEYGVYPQPLGPVGCSRVDVGDIADAAVTGLLEDGYAGSYPLVGPDVLTGEAVAAEWSRVLGREIAYAGDDVDAWAEQASAQMPEWMVEDLKIMYAHFIEQGLVASDTDYARQADILGHDPRPFGDFAEATAAAWTA